MGGERRKAPPPRWLLRARWGLHRVVFRLTGGRLGLREAQIDALGTLRLQTLGRATGEERATMLYYLKDGRDLAVVASNAGSGKDPAWWLNLQASPEAFVDLPDGIHAVIARPADAAERQRLWARFSAADDQYETYRQATVRYIDIVILEPADPSQPVRTHG